MVSSAVSNQGDTHGEIDQYIGFFPNNIAFMSVNPVALLYIILKVQSGVVDITIERFISVPYSNPNFTYE